MDWWLSPELYLRRPPAIFEDYRVDRLLKRKAEEGVQIRIIVYKEVTQTMTLSSAYTKHHFESLSPNIRVLVSPFMVSLIWSLRPLTYANLFSLRIRDIQITLEAN